MKLNNEFAGDTILNFFNLTVAVRVLDIFDNCLNEPLIRHFKLSTNQFLKC